MNYLKKSGELKDALVVGAIQSAALMYENGEIVEACDILTDAVNSLMEFIKNEEGEEQ